MRTRYLIFLLSVVPGAALAASGVTFPASKIDLKPQSVTLPGSGARYEGPGAAVLNTNCLLCHSPAFVDSQPPSPADVWKSEVTKMRDSFGAPIGDAAIPDIVRALVERHGLPAGNAPGGEGEAGASG